MTAAEKITHSFDRKFLHHLDRFIEEDSGGTRQTGEPAKLRGTHCEDKNETQIAKA